MSDSKALEVVSKLLKNLEEIKPRRANYDNVNQDISDYVLPNRGNFIRTSTPGERRDVRIFNNTATTSLEGLAAILHGGLTDPGARWFSLRARDEEVNEDEEFKRWVDEVHKIMFSVFSRSESGFSQQNNEIYLDLLAFGTAVMWVADEPGSGIVFQSRFLGEIYIEENDKGFVDTVYREFKFTARQAAQKWGEEKLGHKLSEAVVKDPMTKFDFVHVVLPKADYVRLIKSELDARLDRFDYISVYISEEDKNVIEVGGFHEMPYIVSRWQKLVGEVYGRSPSWNALSDIIMVNLMEEVTIKSAQKLMDPALLMSDDGVMMPLQTFPGGVNIGAISDDGKALIQPLPSGGRIDISLEMIEQKNAAIRAAFFVDQFQERKGVQPLTATESVHKEENKLRLIGPQVRRVEDEHLSPMVNRVFAILQRRGAFPPLPAILLEKGFDVLDIEYISPLAFTQKSNQLLAYNRFFASVEPLVQFAPETIPMVLNLTDIFRSAAEVSGVPIKEIKTKEQTEAEKQAAADAAAQQQQLAMVQAGAETAATLQKSGIPVVPE